MGDTGYRVEEKCDFCGKIIHGRKATLIKYERRKNEHYHGFCSRECQSNFFNKIKSSIYFCDMCGFEITGRKSRKIFNRINSGKDKNGFCSQKCSMKYRYLHNLIKKHERDKIPDKEFVCPWCGKSFYRKRYEHPKFCSISCSSIFTNKRKDKKPARCIRCNKLTEIDLKQQYNSTVCLECSLIENIRTYRTKCRFRFKVENYPDDFDISLIQKYGWYNRDNNKNGVSRDHLYSVKEGYVNKIDFNLLSHPANCKLMLQKENRDKSNNSSITIEQLKEKIDIWDKNHS